MLIIDDAARRKILTSWSREVELFITDKGPYRCVCGCDHQVMSGHPDRVRCPKCKTLLLIEI